VTLEATSFADASAPALQDFEPGLFGPIPTVPTSKTKAGGSTARGSRGTRPVLSWRDFILPELVDHTENGDPTVRAVSSTEQEHQTLHLLSMAHELSAQMDQARERKLYVQWLKRDPRMRASSKRFVRVMSKRKRISVYGWRER